jgi:hypothetical protein
MPLTVRFLLPFGYSLGDLSADSTFPGAGALPTISMDELHAKFEIITLPTYFLSELGSTEFPYRLENFLVSNSAHSKLKKLILNLCTPTPPGFPTFGRTADTDPLAFGAEWAQINAELSTGAAWKELEEVVLDMSGRKPGDWKAADIERISEYLGRVSLPGLPSKVKLTVLT